MNLLIALAVLTATLVVSGIIARLINGPRPDHIDDDEERWWNAIK